MEINDSQIDFNIDTVESGRHDGKDTTLLNFILIENDDREQVEREERIDKVTFLKKQVLKRKKSDPKTLNLSPSPILAIKNGE
jgi:hypothetical protein